MLKRLLLALSCLGLTNQVLASNTVITNPDSVAPFRVCFTNDGPEEWPEGQDNPLSLLKPSQTIPFCLNQNLSVEAYKDLTYFEKDIFAAVAMWQSYFTSQHTVTINLIINTRSPRCSGAAIPGNTETKTVTLADGTQGEVDVVYPSALHTLMNGNDQNNPDIVVSFHPAQRGDVEAIPLCYDMTPTKAFKHCVASGLKGRDITTTMQHELTHGLGVKTLRRRGGASDSNYGSFNNNEISAYDYQTNNGNGYHDLLDDYQAYYANHGHQIFFTGASTVNYLKSKGLPWPLALCNQNQDEKEFSQNFAHFCYTSCTDPDPKLNYPDLMGMWCLWKPAQQQRIDITDLDLHVLYDIGYAPVLKTTTAVPDLRLKLFNPAA